MAVKESKADKVVKVRQFAFEKGTKNTYRFKEAETPGEPPIIGTLYLQRYLFTGEPTGVKVTVEL